MICFVSEKNVSFLLSSWCFVTRNKHQFKNKKIKREKHYTIRNVTATTSGRKNESRTKKLRDPPLFIYVSLSSSFFLVQKRVQATRNLALLLFRGYIPTYNMRGRFKADVLPFFPFSFSTTSFSFLLGLFFFFFFLVKTCFSLSLF